MTQFHEGQEVEVSSGPIYPWREAFVEENMDDGLHYAVRYRDGTRAVFDAYRILAIESAECQP